MVNARRLFIYILFLLSFGTLVTIDIDSILANEQTLSGIIHFPVKNAQEGQSIYINAKIEDPNIKVEYMRLYYRPKGGSNFQYQEMQEQLNSYSVEIPTSEVKMPGIEYFIMAILTDHSMITSPPSNPYYSPYEISVEPGKTAEHAPIRASQTARKSFLESKSGIQLETIILSPEPGEWIPSDEVIIAVSFLGDVENLDLRSIKLFVDDHNLTAKAEITSNMISFVPAKFPPGKHQIRLELSDIQGNRFNDVAWQFSVISEKQNDRTKDKKLPLAGNAFVEWKSEKFSDSTLTISNFDASFRGKYGMIEYRGRAFITSREKSQFQPRNRFSLEVGTSWIGAKLGDTYPRFNELILWGKRVRGIEAFLKLGFFNLEFAHGQTQRKIAGIPYDETTDPATGITQYVNPVTGLVDSSSTGIYKYGTFKQTLLAIRPSFGSGKNFQFGLNFVKVRDDTSFSTYGRRPKDNLILGPDILLAFDNHRIELKASSAFSLLADDISTGSLSKADLDSALGEVPFDPSQFDKYFILNASLIPTDPSKLTSLAYQASFKFNYFGNNINIIYKSIGSQYLSLANAYLRRDLKGFSIYDRIRLYQNRVYLNLGYEKYVEGLSYNDDENDATKPTDYNALAIGVSFYPRQEYLPKVNVNWKNLNRNDGLDINLNPTIASYAINYRNNDVSVQLGYDVQFLDLNHTFTINYFMNDRSDGFNRTYLNLANDLQMVSLRTAYQIPLITVISYATNKNKVVGGLSTFKYNMFNISADYSLLNRRLNLAGSVNTTSAVGSSMSVDSLNNPLPQPTMSDYTDYQRTAFNIGGNFQINSYHSLLLEMSFIDFNDKLNKAYNDSIIRFRYEFRY